LNDLWLFNTQTNDWKWVSGSDTFNSLGYYGTPGIGSLLNTPPALYGPCMWVDKNGTFWLFAGQDVNSLLYNGMWKFVPDTSCIPTPLAPGIKAQLSQPTICPGDTSLLSITGSTDPVISPFSDVVWIDSVHAYLIPDTTTNYTITDNSPCSATDLANVNLNVLKPALMNYVLPDSQICRGDSVLLTIVNGSGISISPLTGLNWQDSTQAFLSPDSTVTYTITGQSICLGSAKLTKTVHVSAPVVQISSDTNSICAGNSAQICATTGLASYLWNNGESGICIYTRQQGNYYVVARNQFNCPAISNNIGITVLPVPDLSVSLPNPVVCKGDSSLIILTGTPLAVISPSNTVDWVDSVHAFLFPDITTTYTVSSSLPCSADSLVTLSITQPVYMNYSLSDSIICIGNSAALTVINGSDVKLLPSSGVTWTDSADAILAPDTTTTYTLTGQATCVSNNTFVITLDVDAPQISITGDSAMICSGDTVQLCANRGFASYLWNTGDSNLCIYTGRAGVYFVTVRDFNNCPATSNSLPVTLKPEPNISIVVLGDSFNVYNGKVVQWYRNGDPIPGATSQTYVADEPGDYTVAVIDTDGCRTTSGAILLAAGVTDLSQNNIILYPNPSTGVWNLQIGNDWMDGTLDIFDDEGRLIYTSKIQSPRSEIQLNVESGIYLMRLSANGNSLVRKLIKM